MVVNQVAFVLLGGVAWWLEPKSVWCILDLLLGALELFIFLVVIHLSVAKVGGLGSNIAIVTVTLGMSCRIV